MPRIIFLNRFFYPDHSATSQILSDLAFHLAARGRDVNVVTSRQRYDAPGARLPPHELIRGVNVTRVRTSEFGRAALPGRAIDYASCYAGMARAAAALTRPDDIVIAKTDPPLLSLLGAMIARRRKAHLINWLQDLYPEVASATGVPLMNGAAGRALASLRDRSLRAARANVVIGHAMAQRLHRLGVPPHRVHVIANWSDDETIVPRPIADHPLRRDWQLEGQFVVGHSGNLGRTHDVDALLAAAGRLRDRRDIVFVFIGGGTQFDAIRRRAEQDGLGATMRFFSYQPREALPLSLTLPDLHWLSLRPSLEGLIFPSKFYGIAAAGRPMLALTAPGSELANLIARHGCGVAAAPDDAAALAQTIAGLAADPERCAAMGRRARAMLEAQFSRRAALAQWEEILDHRGA
ncbi:MAG: glycosyltransferase family 4 protein [Pseudolabrys sp.]|nr:glycosyltransferase family 4 protein [Pseudolabrys sp.]